MNKQMIVRLIKKITILSYFVRRIRFIFNSIRGVKITNHGFKFVGPKNMQDGSFETEEFELFQEYISSSDIFINVGANIGYYVCAAIKQQKKVLAFEPDIYNYNILLKNIKLNNGEKNCIAMNCGLGNKWAYERIFNASTGSSFIKGWANNSAFFYNETFILKIDDFNFSTYDNLFFWVDVEGFESYVIEGGINTIASSTKQIWVVEIMTNNEYGNFDNFSRRQLDLLSIFENNSFLIFYLEKGKKKSISYNEVRLCIAKRESQYGHNFVFAKVF